jgi:hypothetical protein
MSVVGTLTLRAASERGDVEAFDRLAAELDRPIASALLDEVEPEERSAAERVLPSPSAPPRIDVARLVVHGPVALWLASEWALRVIPERERGAPSPPHEQWDALLDIHRARPEAAWLVIDLLAALGETQRALGRRIVIGLARRFGDRVAPIAEARLRRGPVALDDVLRDLAR